MHTKCHENKISVYFCTEITTEYVSSDKQFNIFTYSYIKDIDQ